LSEFGVLGFEYGYSLASPNTLVLWEAQFGDFYNGAQTIIDQYLSAAESKWRRMSGLVLLLPHGYEGQGPEHSSARLERFLQACAEGNMAVANISTPANLFHILRRQLHRPFRKPLIIMSPKSLLRHPMCVSDLSEFTSRTKFHEYYDDTEVKDPRKVLFCTGKIYYDLLKYRIDKAISDVAIIRIEQLYPFPETALYDLQEKYHGADWVWVQEEPLNMGAWTYIKEIFALDSLEVIGRKASASPATGFKAAHDQKQAEIVHSAFL